jgi:hypothetical protein
MVIGMTMQLKATSPSKSQSSMKRQRPLSPFVQNKRNSPHHSVEPNGSGTSDCPVRDGVHLTVWTANNDEITATAVHLYVLVTARLQPLVAFTHLASKKSWCRTQQISNQSTQKPRLHVLAEVLAVESENTFTHEPMNLAFVC